MPEEKRYRETISKIEIKFGGADEMSAEALVASLDGFINLTKAITVGTDPDSFAKIIIKPPEQGSVLLYLKIIVTEVQHLFSKENVDTAKQVVDTVKEVITLKKFLKGRKPKATKEEKDGSIAVTNHEGEKTKFNPEVATQYFNNAKFDDCIVQIFQHLSNDDSRNDLEIKSSNGKMIVEKSHFREMGANIVDETTQISKRTHRQVIPIDLWVKKPDLVGNSKWGFVYDKNIEAEIKDEAFLTKVRNREFQFGAGSMLPCKLEIVVGLDEKNNPLPARYTVVEVTGKPFVSKDDDAQKKLFGEHHKD